MLRALPERGAAGSGSRTRLPQRPRGGGGAARASQRAHVVQRDRLRGAGEGRAAVHAAVDADEQLAAVEVQLPRAPAACMHNMYM